jgi:hypothetical protein
MPQPNISLTIGRFGRPFMRRSPQNRRQQLQPRLTSDERLQPLSGRARVKSQEGVQPGTSEPEAVDPVADAGNEKPVLPAAA